MLLWRNICPINNSFVPSSRSFSCLYDGTLSYFRWYCSGFLSPFMLLWRKAWLVLNYPPQIRFMSIFCWPSHGVDSCYLESWRQIENTYINIAYFHTTKLERHITLYYIAGASYCLNRATISQSKVAILANKDTLSLKNHYVDVKILCIKVYDQIIRSMYFL